MFHNLELGTKCLITDFSGEPFSAVEENYIYEVIILEDEQTNSTENENSTGSYFLGNFSIFSGDDTSSFCISSEADSVTTNSVIDSERRTCDYEMTLQVPSCPTNEPSPSPSLIPSTRVSTKHFSLSAVFFYSNTTLLYYLLAAHFNPYNKHSSHPCILANTYNLSITKALNTADKNCK